MYDVSMEFTDLDAGAFVARLRRRRRLTQAQLAIRAGTSQAAISRIERGLESPTVDRLAALLQVMGENLALAAEPMQPWADGSDVASERATTADERLEQGILLAEFVTELAAAGDGRDADGR
jgi:transcriptional regulator with XRE-family HTH domain